MSVYDEIYSAYVKDLTAARAEVMKWWDALMAAASPAGDSDEAQKAVRPRWPAGPVSHPRIIDVYRRYHLMIEGINEKKRAAWAARRDDSGSGWGKSEEEDEDEDQNRIFTPYVVLRERLEDHDPELAAFMEYFVFVPIGLDPENQTA
jgi:hypothetical protein